MSLTDYPDMEKFDGTNYSLWSFKMQAVLMDMDLWRVIKADSEEVVDAKIKQKAKFTLILALKDRQLSLVWSCATAQLMWARLKEIYSPRDLARRLFLRREFFTATLEEGGSMLEHITNLKDLALQLDHIGAPIKEQDVVLTILQSLPPSYGTFINSLEEQDTALLTVSSIQAALLHEESTRKDKGPDAADAAPYTEPGDKKDDNGGSSSNFCQKEAHEETNDGKEITKLGSSSSNFCQKEGHEETNDGKETTKLGSSSSTFCQKEGHEGSNDGKETTKPVNPINIKSQDSVATSAESLASSVDTSVADSKVLDTVVQDATKPVIPHNIQSQDSVATSVESLASSVSTSVADTKVLDTVVQYTTKPVIPHNIQSQDSVATSDGSLGYFVEKLLADTERLDTLSQGTFGRLSESDKPKVVDVLLRCMITRPVGVGKSGMKKLGFTNSEWNALGEQVLVMMERKHPERIQRMKGRSILYASFGDFWPRCSKAMDDAMSSLEVAVEMQSKREEILRRIVPQHEPSASK